MQIFSKLQRNSDDKIFIKIILIYFINFLSSYNPFFPIFIGLFILCEGFFAGLFFLIFYCYFHNFNLIYFAFLFVFIKMFLLDRLRDIVDFHYQDVVSLMVIYFMLGVYLVFFANIKTGVLFMYIIYNFAFDLITMRLIKCELKSY